MDTTENVSFWSLFGKNIEYTQGITVCEEFLSTCWVARRYFEKGDTARWELREIAVTLGTGFYTSFWTCAERCSTANLTVSRYQVLQADKSRMARNDR